MLLYTHKFTLWSTNNAKMIVTTWKQKEYMVPQRSKEVNEACDKQLGMYETIA